MLWSDGSVEKRKYGVNGQYEIKATIQDADTDVDNGQLRIGSLVERGQYVCSFVYIKQAQYLTVSFNVGSVSFFSDYCFKLTCTVSSTVVAFRFGLLSTSFYEFFYEFLRVS